MHEVELVFQTQDGEWRHLCCAWVFGLTVAQLLEETQVLQRYPELAGRALGIFGRLVEIDTILEPDDRLEIYTSLKIDPKVARRAKAKKKLRS